MIIAADIGNSTINIGLFTDQGLIVQEIKTWPLKPPRDYIRIIAGYLRETGIDKKPEGCIISSVVPEHTESIKAAVADLSGSEPVMVSCRIDTGIRFDIPHPDKLGADRISNIVAAYEYCKGPAAVVDFGTATTISVVGNSANFIGGAILPGLGIMSQSLDRGTAQLSEVILSPPQQALGIDTDGCIRSGLFWGMSGAVERLLAEIRKEVGYSLTIITTGGYAGIISPFLTQEHLLYPELAMHGLQLLYMRNSHE
jgi:type III pantothenate kinase